MINLFDFLVRKSNKELYGLKNRPDKVKYKGILKELRKLSIFVLQIKQSACVCIRTWYAKTRIIQIPFAVSIHSIL